ADEQGARRDRDLRRHPLARPARSGQGARQARPRARPHGGRAGRGEPGRRSVQGRREPRWARRAARRGRRHGGREGARAHGDPAGGQGAGRLARVVPRAWQARGAPRRGRALDGDERRFRGGDRGRRDDGPGRHGDLRTAPGAAGARTGATMTIKGLTVGFVGGGNMGEALMKGLLGANLVPSGSIHATDVRLDRLKQLDRQYGIQVSSDNAELVRRSDIVILAVKPQIMEAVLKEIAPAVTRKKLLISIAAGVSTSKIRAVLHKDARLIRVMPNTPALVLEGVTAIAKADGLEPDDLDTAGEIFSAVGRVVVLDEALMDAGTGGSGPAYVAVVIESLADGGVRMGLDRITAMTLATQTVLGAAKLLLETGLHPGALKDMVSSPGGTSIAGIAALEEGGIRTTFIK